ncbi:hypothetical protein [Brochothrix campestris]|nr:hypothetical protein [Brochothrix campestris]
MFPINSQLLTITARFFAGTLATTILELLAIKLLQVMTVAFMPHLILAIFAFANVTAIATS